MRPLNRRDPLAASLKRAIQSGDIPTLRSLLGSQPGLASARIEDDKGSSCTLLHLAADWPGYFPNGPQIVRLLVEAGADPNGPIIGGRHAETPLHWAASSDDLDVADALMDLGADLEARGASIAGGTPLDDAVAYGCWHVAHRLVERGARVDKLWHAAALGLTARAEALLAGPPAPTPTEINDAFWQACHGGQRRMAERLLACGADLNWVPVHTTHTPLGIAGTIGTAREALVSWLGEQGAKA